MFTLLVAALVRVLVLSSVVVLLGGAAVDMFQGAVSSIPWLRYFAAWDSGWYTAIAAEGYTVAGTYAFFPLYPMLMKYLGMLVGGDVVLAGFLISVSLGVAWVPFFENIAEDYMDRRQALFCTLTTSCFPYILVFTSVVYTESLFLFSTVLAWFLYKQDRLVLSGIIAAVATLTKTYGILILIPMIADTLFKKKWRRLPRIATVPFLSLFGWMGYLYRTTGDAFAFVTARRYWPGDKTVWWLISPILAGNPTEYVTRSGAFQISYEGGYVPFLAITIFVLFGIMVLRVWDIDWRLALFSTSLMVIILIMGSVDSLVRFFSFAFPIWFTIRANRSFTVVLLIGLFAVFTVALWYQFLMGWIG